MDALEALINRTSCPKLEGPAPTADQLESMLQAAVRAPDHGALRPWRFILTEGEGLVRMENSSLVPLLQPIPSCRRPGMTSVCRCPCGHR